MPHKRDNILFFIFEKIISSESDVIPMARMSDSSIIHHKAVGVCETNVTAVISHEVLIEARIPFRVTNPDFGDNGSANTSMGY